MWATKPSFRLLAFTPCVGRSDQLIDQSESEQAQVCFQSSLAATVEIGSKSLAGTRLIRRRSQTQRRASTGHWLAWSRLPVKRNWNTRGLGHLRSSPLEGIGPADESVAISDPFVNGIASLRPESL
jgi:hypothetical protein